MSAFEPPADTTPADGVLLDTGSRVVAGYVIASCMVVQTLALILIAIGVLAD